MSHYAPPPIRPLGGRKWYQSKCRPRIPIRLLCTLQVLKVFREDSQTNSPAISAVSYQQRLLKLNLESLELRRIRFDLIYYYNILSNLTPIDPNIFFITYQSNPSSRSQSASLHRTAKTTARVRSTFLYRSTVVLEQASYLDKGDRFPHPFLISNLAF